MKSNFFESNSYFIDEKVNFLKFENSYQIFNDNGENIGTVKQRLTTGQKVLRLLLSKKMLPFLLEIKNADDMLEASISRNWTLFMSKISIKDPEGNKIGTIQQKFNFLKPKFKIYNAAEAQIAEIKGDWKAWEFVINDSSENNIGSISKKWAGAMKEFFTSADKYNVTINPNYSNIENKIIILS